MRPRRVVLHVSTDRLAIARYKILIETRLHCRVFSALDEEEAVELAEREALDLVIIDLVAKRLDADRFLWQLKKATRLIPRLLLVERKATFASADPTLIEPRPVELLDQIRLLLKRKSGPPRTFAPSEAACL